MATRRHSQLSSYRTYGSVAYAPAYDGTAVRAPRREEVLRPKPRVRPRERVLTRTQVQVREAGQASVFAVIGFLAVGVFFQMFDCPRRVTFPMSWKSGQESLQENHSAQCRCVL